MEDKRLVRIGFAQKSRSSQSQNEGMTGEKGFNMPVSKSERDFLLRLSKVAQRHASRYGDIMIFVQDMEEAR